MLECYVMSGTKLHADDTPVPVLQPGRRTTGQDRSWTYARDDRADGIDDPPAIWFAYSPDRKAKWPAEHLADFRGTLQVDGHAGFHGTRPISTVWRVAAGSVDTGVR